jgi:hypothetical protein
MAGITEKEAKDKWCCQTMAMCGDGGEHLQICCGSECMAWRISQPKIDGMIEIDTSIEKVTNEIKTQEELGYCGFAGMPNF